MEKKQLKRKNRIKKCNRLLIPVFILLILSGCGQVRKETLPDNVKLDRDITVSNDTVKPNGKIVLSYAGYEPEGSKLAILTGLLEEKEFDVIDQINDEVVYTGSIRYKNITGIIDFSDYSGEGSYYIKTASGVCSDDFNISRDAYRKLLAERISRFGETAKDEEKINTGNFPYHCLSVTDRLLTQEFFPAAIDTEAVDDPMIIPRTVLLAKSEVDQLKEMTDENGEFKAQYSFGLSEAYRYSAVMSLFSYEYERFDKTYAAECLELADTVYKRAEKDYKEASDKDKKEADDKRYWASAQMYKLTGRNDYRSTAEDYAKDPPKGFSKERCGYLGTVAYLTSYNRINLNIGEILITSLMGDINDAVRESFKEEYLVAVKDEPDDKEIEIIYENARLMVLGNYIFKNLRYVEAGESQVAYLYGRNPLGKDYAYDTESEYYNEPMEFILAGLIDSYIYEDKKPEAMKRQ